MVWGQDFVFYDTFESGDTAGWWASARVGETGQISCYDEETGIPIACAGTGQDGDIQPGVAWPNPRFVDNGDGTVADTMTGLVWLKDASCESLPNTDTVGRADWTTALATIAGLASGACGLGDGSVAGGWRLPSVNELESLLDFEYVDPSLSNTAGTGQWTEGDAFSGYSTVYPYYWSATSVADHLNRAWAVNLNSARHDYSVKGNKYSLWPVRDDDAGSWAPARVGETGQQTCSNQAGDPIACAGTGQDGDIQPGVAWPNPRFVDNGDGTVTDMLTGLVWLMDASCGSLAGTDSYGKADWPTSMGAVGALASGNCGLTDGSTAGDWRIPSIQEMLSLVDYEYDDPALSNAAGSGQWTESDAFTGVATSSDPSPCYWSTTFSVANLPHISILCIHDAYFNHSDADYSYYSWPVRGGF